MRCGPQFRDPGGGAVSLGSPFVPGPLRQIQSPHNRIFYIPIPGIVELPGKSLVGLPVWRSASTNIQRPERAAQEALPRRLGAPLPHRKKGQGLQALPQVKAQGVKGSLEGAEGNEARQVPRDAPVPAGERQEDLAKGRGGGGGGYGAEEDYHAAKTQKYPTKKGND